MDAKVIASKFQLIQSNVLEFTFENNQKLQPNNDDIIRRFNTDYSIPYIDKRNSMHVGAIELTINVRRSYKSIDDRFKATLRVNGLFTAPIDSMDEDMFHNMLELNGTSALYGIARGKLAALSSQCYPEEPLLLPMINVNKLVSEHHKKHTTEE